MRDSRPRPEPPLPRDQPRPQPVAAALHRVPRLYREDALTAGAELALTREAAHYLAAVLRRGPDDPVRVFNPRDGEWLARLGELGRKGGRLRCETRLRPPAAAERDAAGPWLLFAPLKRGPLELLVQKATELGADRLLPVLTGRTAARGALDRADRLAAIAMEAAEQSERLAPPEIAAPRPLAEALDDWPAGRALLVCDETGGASLAGTVAALAGRPGACLIGPEGGFLPSELDALGKLSFVSRVSLGPRILRAETAALAVLSCWQALAGDWPEARPPGRDAVPSP